MTKNCCNAYNEPCLLQNRECWKAVPRQRLQLQWRILVSLRRIILLSLHTFNLSTSNEKVLISDLSVTVSYPLLKMLNTNNKPFEEWSIQVLPQMTSSQSWKRGLVIFFITAPNPLYPTVTYVDQSGPMWKW